MSFGYILFNLEKSRSAVIRNFSMLEEHLFRRFSAPFNPGKSQPISIDLSFGKSTSKVEKSISAGSIKISSSVR